MQQYPEFSDSMHERSRGNSQSGETYTIGEQIHVVLDREKILHLISEMSGGQEIPNADRFSDLELVDCLFELGRKYDQSPLDTLLLGGMVKSE